MLDNYSNKFLGFLESKSMKLASYYWKLIGKHIKW